MARIVILCKGYEKVYKSNCYNFEWFQSWLRNNYIEKQNAEYPTTPAYIADNFSRLYFPVTEQDAEEALKGAGFTPKYLDGKCVFFLDPDSPARKKFWTTYD